MQYVFGGAGIALLPYDSAPMVTRLDRLAWSTILAWPWRFHRSAKLNRRSTGPSARAGAVRNRPLRLRQHWRDLIGITDIEQETFGNLARHLSRCEVDDKQRLPAFNLLWRWPLLFRPTRMERAWSPKSTRSRTSFSECA